MSTTPQDLTGRTILVTGATSGVGREAAKMLAARGADLGLLVRDPARGAQVVAEITQAGGLARLFVGDLSLLADVRRVASEVQSAYPRIQVLVNNAGAMFSPRQLTSEGIERTWALNVLSPVLLSRLLKDHLAQSRPARVVNTSSIAHRWGRIRFDDLSAERHYGMLRTYAQAKLALLMLSFEMARRWDGQGITVNALHPGFVRSGFGHNNSRFLGAMNRLAEVLGPSIPPEKGALTTVYAATSPDLDGKTGLYLAKERAVPSSRRSLDTAASARLWEIVARQLALPTAG